MFARNSPISRHVAERHHALRQRRSRTGITRRTDACIDAMPAKGSSTTQSISTPGRLRATSLTAGQLCTTSPSDEVLTKRILSVGQSHLKLLAAIVWDKDKNLSAPPRAPLSAVLITRNAAAVLDSCLESLAFADEMLIVDSASSDGTLEIAARRGARVVQKEWLGFGRQKQFAVDQAKNDWVLCIDADERVSAELAASIGKALAAPVSPVYRMPRRNRFLGRWLSHGEGYPDWSPRLFNRQNARWSEIRETRSHAATSTRCRATAGSASRRTSRGWGPAVRDEPMKSCESQDEAMKGTMKPCHR